MPVYHLKHRPRSILELDLAMVRKNLTLILKQEDRPGAFLFAGPKGAGKTSAARVLARAVNCENLSGVDPCNNCENCKEILSGASIDLVEIDGASNRGIDDVRLLRERAYLSASKLKVKVFIIDEVHMLTREAFNALLKLLEEPPKNTLFIMCTTEPAKIPETVLSRLVRVDFTKGKKEELMTSLERVVKGEKIKIDKKGLELLAEKSDGSFRNLHMMLAGLVMGAGKKISLKQVEEFVSSRVGGFEGEELESDLNKGRARVILQTLEKLAGSGIDLAGLRLDWLNYFQKRLLSGFGLGKMEGELGGERVRQFLELLAQAGEMERLVDLPQLPLQLAVVEFLGKGQGNALSVQEQKRGEKNQDLSVQKIENRWGELLAAVKPFNHSVEALMRSSRPENINGKVLTLGVFYPFHKEKLEEEKNRRIVEEGLKRVFDCDLGLKCVLSEAKKVEANRDSPVREEADKDLYDVAKEIFG